MKAEEAPSNIDLIIQCPCGTTVHYKIQEFGKYNPVKACDGCGVIYVVSCSVAFVTER